MLARHRLWLSALFALTLLALLPARGQSAAAAAPEALLTAPEAAKLLPSSVFFRGQSAPVQARNSGGIKFSDGKLMLAALVDNSGYSTAIQQKYQAYLITEVTLDINGHSLPPGSYGVGFVQGNFGVLDIANNELFSVKSVHDTEIKRPTPLQLLPDGTAGHYRLYQGRDYVVVSRTTP